MAENEFLDIKDFARWRPVLEKLEAGAPGHELGADAVALLLKLLSKLRKRNSNAILEAAAAGDLGKLTEMTRELNGAESDFAALAAKACRASSSADGQADLPDIIGYMSRAWIDKFRTLANDCPRRRHEADSLAAVVKSVFNESSDRFAKAVLLARSSRGSLSPQKVRIHGRTRLALGPRSLIPPASGERDETRPR